MQFVKGGPDIPERLLQMHEDGRLVFFCGAGISYPARLPGFAGLVQKTFAALGEMPDAVQQAAIKAGQFDTAIGLLEASIAGGREAVRRAIGGILTPNLSARNATATHEALLTLGKTRDGRTRLVTTNFDRIFEEVVARNGLAVERYRAPLLRVPKSSWDGLVYLHGLLTDPPTTSDLNCLVVSSGDFGLAYLTERWAARFVSELFRNYTVCFVGYSINDPVLRYMMDALAADRLLGETPPEMFAFGSYSKRERDQRSNEWKAKNVTPILYREHNRHAYLHRTLQEWAATYRDGVRGNERIVIQCAIAKPLSSTQEDDFVGRMVWALSDPAALPAKRFAEFDPVPSLDWLEPLSTDRYRFDALPRFGVLRQLVRDDALAFSLTRRPAHYSRTPRMMLVDSGARSTQWDDVMLHLGRWLVRHLDDPKLVLWLAKQGGCLHEQFAWLIERRLENIAKLEQDSKAEELTRIRLHAPRAIPRPAMRTLWRLLLTGRIRSNRFGWDLYAWASKVKRSGLTPTLRIELREMLAPRVSIREPYRFTDEQAEEGDRPKDLASCDIVLSTDHVHSALNDLKNNARWMEALPNLLPDLTVLLRDALDLMREFGGATDTSDFSYIHQPSISAHPQNKAFHDWTALVELARDSWVAFAVLAPSAARAAAEQWWTTPYPIFKRLAFFAATHENVVPHRLAVEWLLGDGRWWLWSVETEREAMRLLVALAPRLDAAQIAEVERAILLGPPREMFRDDIEPGRWTELVEREVWLRLAKFKAGGAALGAAAEAEFMQIADKHPEWQLADDERDEFPHWTGEADSFRKFVATPRRRRELVEWLRTNPSADFWQEDDWRRRCREDFSTTACALFALSREGVWPADRWRDALQAWSEEQLLQRSWRYMASVLVTAPDDVVLAIAHGISWWLRAIAKTFEGRENLFIDICRRVLAQPYPGDDRVDDPVGRAINHPVGHTIDALLKYWYRQRLEDDQGIPDSLRLIFTDVCDRQVGKFKHGRVLLAAHVIALFRVHRQWAVEHLLPLFDWQLSPAEARAAWEGFLWSPRLYRPLMEALRVPFLETAHHYEAIGDHSEQYAAVLTHAALDRGDTFSVAQLASATRALPAAGLAATAQTLLRAQEGAGDQRVDYWSNRIEPYLRSIWPKARDRVTPAIAESFARLCIETGPEFPRAFEILRPLLRRLEHADYVVHRLHDANLSSQFPSAALAFLDLLVDDQSLWLPTNLRDCLAAIGAADPQLIEEHRYQRLLTFVRRHEPG